MNLEFLVEEPSTERALRLLLPKIIPGVPFEIRDFRGKGRLLSQLPNRLLGYRSWIDSTSTCVVVVVDRDDDDCVELNARLRRIAEQAGMRTQPGPFGPVQVLIRIAIEELEAWFFGDVAAIQRAYPKVSVHLGKQARYRDPDAITGGTWEALERVLQERGYHATGLRKLQAATDIAAYMDVEANRSGSFQAFREGLRRLVKEGDRDA
ncbi:MAG: DUF4276 family protein [Actinophytocola sp.]|nr:DUF4276 family protein [Actinophytocola sp.]